MARTTSNVKAEFDSAFKSVTSSVYNKVDGETLTSSKNLIGGLTGINAITPEQDIDIDYLRTGPFKLGLPKYIRDFTEAASTVLGPVVSALNAINSVLEAIQDIIPQRSDALSSLLASIISQVNALLDTFSSVDASVRVLPIPPIHPTSSFANLYTPADIVAAEAYAELISGAYSRVIQSSAFPSEDPEKLRRMLLGEQGPSARYKNGSSGFLSAIKDSFEDSLDGNRPTESTGYTAGASIQVGAPTSSILGQWEKIKSTFLSMEESLATSYVGLGLPQVRILSAKSMGKDSDDNLIVRVRTSNLLPVLGRDPLREEEFLYYPARIAFSFVHNTSTSKFSADRESNLSALSTFNSPNMVDVGPEKIVPSSLIPTYATTLSGAQKPEFMYSIVGDGSKFGVYTATLSVYESAQTQLFINSEENLLSVSLSREDLLRLYIDREYMDIDIKIYDFLAGRSLDTLLSRVNSGIGADAKVRCTVWYKKMYYSAGEYIARTVVGNSPAIDRLTDGLTAVLSSPAPLRFQPSSNKSINPVLPGGLPPNWIRYGKKYQIPVIKDTISAINRFSSSLEASISSTKNTLSLAISAQLKVLEKIQTQINVLNNIVVGIDKILNTNIGGNCVLFTSNGGASGPLKALVDHYSGEEARFASAEQAGVATTDIDWFANGESVCGIVILATSETAESANRFIDLMMLLLGNGEASADRSGQSVIPITPTLAGAEFSSLPELQVTSSELFSDNFLGLSPQDHQSSPENACD